MIAVSENTHQGCANWMARRRPYGEESNHVVLA